MYKITIKAPLGIGIYAGISTVLFSFIKEKDLTANFVAGIVLAFATGILLYINVSFSEKHEELALKKNDHHYCPYFWTMTFILGTGMGLLTCWILNALHWWNLCLAFTIWAGIYAFSHVLSHETNVLEHHLKNINVKPNKDDIFIDWLKLDHNFSQNVFQILISIIGLIVTGGIVGYFLYKGDFWSPGMQSTVFATIWGIIGLWFGVLVGFRERCLC